MRTINSGEMEIFAQSTLRLIKTARVSMDTIASVLIDVQSRLDNASGAKIFARVVEDSDLLSQSFSDGSGGADSTSKAAAPVDDGNMFFDKIGGNGQKKVETSPEVEQEGEGHNDKDAAKGAEVQGANGDHIIGGNETMGDDTAASPKHDNAATTAADNEGKVEGSGKQKKSSKAQKVGNIIEPADAHVDDTAREDGGRMDNDDQRSESNLTHSEGAYAEYNSWPRDLKIYDQIKTTLFNGVRKDMLKCLSQGEETKSGH